MPKRGKLLSEFEQGQIIGMTESGRSISEIRETSAEATTVSRIFWQEPAIINMEGALLKN